MRDVVSTGKPMGNLERLFERNRYSELRRRTIRLAMQPLFHASDVRLTLTRDLSGQDIHRILICRPNHRLGNLLLVTPLVAEIQRLFPDAGIDIVLAGEHVAELFQTFPNVRHIYNLSRRMVRHPVELACTLARIRRARYDLAIDPCEASQSSRLLVALARPKYVVGIPRSRSSRAPVPSWMERAPAHMAQWPVHLLRGTLGHQAPIPDREFPPLDIRLSEDERERARTVLAQLLHALGMRPGRAVMGVFAEATGAKSYGGDWWRRFIGEVRARHPGLAVVEIAPPDGHQRLAGFPFFSSPSPREVAAVISNMTCFVSADCGVMHLASASGIPTIGLFSVTDASKYAPYGHGSQGLVTNGKSPEEVAQLASALMGSSIACDSPASPDRSGPNPGNHGEGQ